MQIVDVDLVLNHVEAQIITPANYLPTLDASASHPHAEGLAVMVSSLTVLFTGFAVFNQGSAAKFPSPNH